MSEHLTTNDKLLLQQYIQDDTPKINIIATNNTPVEILDR